MRAHRCIDAAGPAQAAGGQSRVAEGEFDEPVGIAIDGQNNIYVTDTWNQRVQVFEGLVIGAFEDGRGTFHGEVNWIASDTRVKEPARPPR